ncbi:MAG: hypothetical protein DMD45_07095 [Gemmatimonadetes bacterium]|nr:MAG: hypothetical protein DMD45_07095 [Gemmatimonadota bacterium]
MTSHPVALDTVAVPPRRTLDLLVLDRVKIQAWDRILFVECGDGWIAEEAWRRAVRAYVCGLDLSVALIALARQLREVPGKLEFRTWDRHRLPTPDGAFDRVVATFVPLGVVDPAALLRDVQRVLRPAGDVYLLYPAASEGELRRGLTRAGFTEPHELARFDGQRALLMHARAGRQKIV